MRATNPFVKFPGIGLAIALGLLGAANEVFAQRPSAPRLFADNTLAYVRIDDTRDMKAKMADSS
ncbi:MAG: hypothetical protein ACK43N_17675, partial [Pirellulaceae bacterium]